MKPIPRFVALLLSLLLLLAATVSLAAGEPSQFAVIGDTKIGTTESVFMKFLKKTEAEGINLIFLTGDVIDRPGTVSEWQRFFELTGTARTIHIAPGNHDINNYKSLKAYKEYTGRQPYYSFSAGDTQFVILCTELPDAMGKITGKQLAWLKGEFEKPFPFRIVFLHRPLFPTPVGTGYGLDRHPQERDALHSLFVKAGVRLVFTGHEHLYNRSEKDGVTYAITGGGGSRLIAFRGEDGGFYHYIVAKRRNEGYVVTVYDLDGNRRDEFFINR